jgi:ribonuclease I
MMDKSRSLDKDVRDEIVEERRQMLKERPVQCQYTREHYFYGKGIWDTDPNNIYSQDTHPMFRTRSRKLSDLPDFAKVDTSVVTQKADTVPGVH